MKLHILIPVLIALHFSNSKIHCHQRKVSHLATSLCSVGLLLGTCAPFSFSVASADVGSVPGFSDVRGNLAQKAQKIPGFGPADVVFPKRFEGLWDVEQTVTAVIDNPREKNSFIDSLDGGAERKDLRLIAKLRKAFSTGKPIKFSRLYVKKEDGSVVQDRGFSATKLYSSLLDDNYARAMWDQNNPNLLTIETSDNLVQEDKVTKRSQESEQTAQQIELPNGAGKQSMDTATMIGFSEYSRISEGTASSISDQRDTSINAVSGVRLLARYKLGQDPNDNQNEILGLERLYVYPGNSLDLGKEKPVTVVKSKIVMKKIKR